jgi:PKHD-type hydroxylase
MILENYVWQAPSFFSRKEIDDLHRASDKLQFQAGQVGGGLDNQDRDGEKMGGTEDWSVRSSQVKWFEMENNHMPEHLLKKINDAVTMANRECRWNHNIEYMENPQYTIYNEQPDRKGDFYTWHTDAGPVPYGNGMHRKLSMTIQLSDQDDYEGGHFQWLEPATQFDKMTGTNPQVNMADAISTLSHSAKSIGSVVIFPSFLYHQVTPILSGTRKSLVCWMVGHPYV